MSPEDVMGALGGWKGYRVQRLTWTSPHQQPHAEVVIELTPESSAPLICARCQEAVLLTHDQTLRRVRDLSVFEYRTVLVFPRRRVWCPRCGGPQLEHLEWLAPHARSTRRFEQLVATLAQELTISATATLMGLHWSTVQSIHEEYLTRHLGDPDLDGVVHIAMDEFAVRKGHRYATVIADAATRRVLWIAKGRSREAIRPFFETLGPERCARIQVAVMDMSSAFDLEVKAHCPQAAIVYDKFHVLAKYNREVVDRVRVDRANELRGDTASRKMIKGSKWLLLRNRKNLPDEQRVRLEELLAANAPLATVDVLRDDLKTLWESRDKQQAASDWAEWLMRAAESGIAPLMIFARRLKPYLHGLLAHCRWPLNTGFLEGMNNTIKVLKRKAYGYRNEHYFFLRIRAAFPGTNYRGPPGNP